LYSVQSGKYVPLNLTKAIEYFNYSASFGNPSAQYALAFSYETGKGMTVNKPLVSEVQMSSLSLTYS
jgi:TPR repeat protein